MWRLLLLLSSWTPAACGTETVSLRVMTYNVHSCKGVDRRIRPERIAEVIRTYRPDVVALQEIRVGRASPGGGKGTGVVPPAVGEPPLPPPTVIAPRRPGAAAAVSSPFIDQPGLLADRAGMYVVFYPLVRLATEDYGLAVLSRYPMRVVRADNLPTSADRPLAERRGALWVELDIEGRPVQLLNTHLGLNGEEREAQVEALLGKQWLAGPSARRPAIICGDLNSGPSGEPYQRLTGVAVDASRLAGGGPPRTFPSLLPLLRLDHVFVSEGTAAAVLRAPSTPLTRWASDHLPVVADLVLPLP